MLSFIATAIRLLSGLVINKAIAIIIGPSGLALIGQFQNTQNMIRTFSQGGINAGVTKYTSECNSKGKSTLELWSASFKTTVFFSLIASLILIIFSSELSIFVFKTDVYTYVFVLFGITLIFSALNQLLLSILNGLKEIDSFIKINIFQSLFSLVFTTSYILIFGLDGAFIALVTNQSIIFLVILWYLRKHPLIKFSSFFQGFNFGWTKKLTSYSLMALTSSIAVPCSQILIRDNIGQSLSWEDAGYWQAMTYISTMYLLVVTTALSTYYLPKLSEISGSRELKNELLEGYKYLLPIVATLTLIVYFCRAYIVELLFTEDFMSMLVLFKWQLIGDFMKISSWLVAYVMLAKALTKIYIVSELVFSVLYVLLAQYFVSAYGLVGVSYAFAVNYFIYFICMVFVVSRYISGLDD
ncbi:O-antigen translocase [Vibrio mediterranei]|uniref:O-antigen translocase n=1 Tax=Vibrio mediterranei TaxID=689 RepID=UPI001E2D1C5B|nr:O-antigen translocase [Vibrio mediterranei]